MKLTRTYVVHHQGAEFKLYSPDGVLLAQATHSFGGELRFNLTGVRDPVFDEKPEVRYRVVLRCAEGIAGGSSVRVLTALAGLTPPPVVLSMDLQRDLFQVMIPQHDCTRSLNSGVDSLRESA